jgi:ABC-type multidrug transport system ATPase subunit
MQQRVALARAMAPRPEILLLDEPFSSMDAELREQLAREVRDVLKREGVTAILVTHDQLEAFAMADLIGVIGDGRVRQWGTRLQPVSRAGGPLRRGLHRPGRAAAGAGARRDSGQDRARAHRRHPSARAGTRHRTPRC